MTITRELEKLKKIANEKYDGHLTLMKFTTNWRCCLGTPSDIFIGSRYMASGETMDEAISKCLDQQLDWIDVHNGMVRDGIINEEQIEKGNDNDNESEL